MVKNGFSSLIRGIFYTIGKIIAFILIGLLIGFLAVKFNVPIKNLVMLEAHAQENLSGAWTMYLQNSNGNTLPTQYTSTLSGITFPSSSYTQVPGSTINTNPNIFTVVTRVDIQPTYTYVKGNSYTITLNFDTGSYIIPYFPVNSSNWFVSQCTNSLCNSTPNVTYTYTLDSSHQSTNTLQVVIKFLATSNTSNSTIVLGNLTDAKGNFYNQYSLQQGVRINSATIDEIDNSVDFTPVIDNQNQNTQDIINNNNQNTTNIINNQNQIAQQQEELQKVCNSINYTYKDIIESGFLNVSTGDIASSSSYGVGKYIAVDNSSDIIFVTDLSSNAAFCFYDNRKIMISCDRLRNYSVNDTLTIPSNAKYFRSSFSSNTNNPSYNIYSCKNGNQALSDDINDLNNTLKDDNLPDVINSGGGGGTYFDDLNGSSDTPISDLLLLPLNLLNKVNDNLSTSCSAYTIPFDFTGGNNTLTFPCLNIQNYVGSNLWSIIDAMFSIFMIYNIFRLIVRFYDSWTSLDDTYFSFLKGGVN